MSRAVIIQVKRTYATAAHGVGLAMSRVGIFGGEIPSRDRRIKHWLNSLVRVHDSLAIAELDVPWWTYRAIDITEAWLSARQRPIRVFEYGAGASTLWLADRADEVVSVEHHAGFAKLIGPVVAQRGNATLHLVEPSRSDAPKAPSAKEGCAGLDFSEYVETIDRVGGVFDLIVVDGRAREACLVAAVRHLAEHGMIVFDNSRRRRYRGPIERSGLAERRLPGLTPTLPYPDQTSLLFSAPVAAR